MKTDKAIIIAMAAILIITAVAIGFVAYDNRLEQVHPVGPMTGDEQIHPHDPASPMIPMDEMIYIPAYPGDECTPPDRALIGTPLRVVNTDGTVYWHWFYENRSAARNQTRNT